MRALDEHNRSHYGPDQCRWASDEALCAPNTTVLGARLDEQLVGIGAVTLEPDYAEIKRMFVVESTRGHGVGARVLEALLAIARRAGKTLAKLETAERFEAAIALYQRFGFLPCPAFGPYRSSPVNTYMECAIKPRP